MATGRPPCRRPAASADSAHDDNTRSDVSDGISGSERFLQTHGWLPSGQNADLHVHYDVPPLGVHAEERVLSG
jgi:hypothetical protein